MHKIAQRLQKLRERMRQEDISAYIIPGTDPFLSEYLPACWNQREYISGFTGSAGKIVVTENDAGLWTDSRYFLQAEKELSNTGIQLFKSGLPETPNLLQWITRLAGEGKAVGLNPLLFSVRDYRQMEKELSAHRITLKSVADFVDAIWIDRPPLPLNKAIVLSDTLTGETVAQKLSRLREHMTAHTLDGYFISSLDEIAWLFNIRGTDIAYNPVCIAYALVTAHDAFLYIHPEKVPEELASHTSITCVTMDAIEDHLKHQVTLAKVGIDPVRLNYGIFKALQQFHTPIEDTSWVSMQKALKNPTELKGIEDAMVKDGVALVRFFMWLEEELSKGNQPGEHAVGVQLNSFRSLQNDFKDDSFSPIAGYQENGAIVHYSAKAESDRKLTCKGIFLLDSGGQYSHGTTDITRTVALGAVPQQAKVDYTLVLKGHLALSHATFPQQTRGDQLDALARQFLWHNNLDYGHGTGHGVGHYLNVHEGPHSIRKEHNPVTLQPGMICSVEPGVYRQGEYGIRIENLVVVTEKETNPFGQFLTFRTLTLFPYDLQLMDTELLTKTEISQINSYHQTVKAQLLPHLSPNEKDWLEKKTRSITTGIYM